MLGKNFCLLQMSAFFRTEFRVVVAPLLCALHGIRDAVSLMHDLNFNLFDSCLFSPPYRSPSSKLSLGFHFDVQEVLFVVPEVLQVFVRKLLHLGVFTFLFRQSRVYMGVISVVVTCALAHFEYQVRSESALEP